MAKLYFRHGVMAAAKTSNLLQAAFSYKLAGMEVLLAKPGVDTKGGTSITSRIGLEQKVDLIIPDSLDLKSELQKIIETFRSENKALSCILVDEAQFLTPAQVDQLLWIAVWEDVPVLAYGLRTDFLTQVFPGSARLLSIAHSVEEIKTVCPYDGSKAIFNARKDKTGAYTTTGEQIAIDGEDFTYEALCAHCYMSKVAPLA